MDILAGEEATSDHLRLHGKCDNASAQTVEQIFYEKILDRTLNLNSSRLCRNSQYEFIYEP